MNKNGESMYSNLQFSDVNNVYLDINDNIQENESESDILTNNNSVITSNPDSDKLFLKFRCFIKWRNYVRSIKKRPGRFLEVEKKTPFPILLIPV